MNVAEATNIARNPWIHDRVMRSKAWEVLHHAGFKSLARGLLDVSRTIAQHHNANERAQDNGKLR